MKSLFTLLYPKNPYEPGTIWVDNLDVGFRLEIIELLPKEPNFQNVKIRYLDTLSQSQSIITVETIELFYTPYEIPL